MLLPYSSLLIILLNEAGALTNPKGMPLNWCNPLWVTKAVKALSSSVIGTCQYPLEKSNVEKYWSFSSFAKISSGCGMGSGSNTVTLLSFQKSTQNLFDPSGLRTTTTGDE